jgi:hypothetical protein
MAPTYSPHLNDIPYREKKLIDPSNQQPFMSPLNPNTAIKNYHSYKNSIKMEETNSLNPNPLQFNPVLQTNTYDNNYLRQ